MAENQILGGNGNETANFSNNLGNGNDNDCNSRSFGRRDGE
jgi:hypothetical protein